MTDKPTSEGVDESVCFACLARRCEPSGSYTLHGRTLVVGPGEPCDDPKHEPTPLDAIFLDGWRKGREAADQACRMVMAQLKDSATVREAQDRKGDAQYWWNKADGAELCINAIAALPEPKE